MPYFYRLGSLPILLICVSLGKRLIFLGLLRDLTAPLIPLRDGIDSLTIKIDFSESGQGATHEVTVLKVTVAE